MGMTGGRGIGRDRGGLYGIGKRGMGVRVVGTFVVIGVTVSAGVDYLTRSQDGAGAIVALSIIPGRTWSTGRQLLAHIVR